MSPDEVGSVHQVIHIPDVGDVRLSHLEDVEELDAGLSLEVFLARVLDGVAVPVFLFARSQRAYDLNVLLEETAGWEGRFLGVLFDVTWEDFEDVEGLMVEGHAYVGRDATFGECVEGVAQASGQGAPLKRLHELDY
jgi:hypothetical protein